MKPKQIINVECIVWYCLALAGAAGLQSLHTDTTGYYVIHFIRRNKSIILFLSLYAFLSFVHDSHNNNSKD